MCIRDRDIVCPQHYLIYLLTISLDAGKNKPTLQKTIISHAPELLLCMQRSYYSGERRWPSKVTLSSWYEYNMDISTFKTIVMVFRGKTLLDQRQSWTVQQLNKYRMSTIYLGYDITCGKSSDIDNKLTKFMILIDDSLGTWWNISIQRFVTVSYTHLDVYKRQ